MYRRSHLLAHSVALKTQIVFVVHNCVCSFQGTCDPFFDLLTATSLIRNTVKFPLLEAFSTQIQYSQSKKSKQEQRELFPSKKTFA